MAYLTFENSVYLWYLLSIPLLIASHFYFLRYAKYRGMRFANFETLKRVKGDKIFTKNYILLGLRIIILASLIFAASGTTLWYEGVASNTDYVVALDVSASMTSQDVEPSRIDASKEFISGFLDELEQEDISADIGLITFSGSTYIEQRLTNDFDAFRTSLEEVYVRREGGTDIAGAVVTGANMLIGSEKSKSIILISDGSVTVTADEDDSYTNAVDYAREEQVKIHSIGVGTNTGPLGYLPEYYNVSAVFNRETLINLANTTSGTYNVINQTGQGPQEYEEILEESETTNLSTDLSYGLMLFSILLIFLEWGLVSTRFRRLP